MGSADGDRKVERLVEEMCIRDSLGTMLASGTPDEIQKNPDVIKAYLGERRKRNGK